jgi:hypothetical protein
MYHTKLKKSEIDICTRISHFAKRTVGFRELSGCHNLYMGEKKLTTWNTCVHSGTM